MATDYQEAIRILSEQEKILQFDSFTSEDAWKLGNFSVCSAIMRCCHTQIPPKQFSLIIPHFRFKSYKQRAAFIFEVNLLHAI